jgi:hypothetical protein
VFLIVFEAFSAKALLAQKKERKRTETNRQREKRNEREN